MLDDKLVTDQVLMIFRNLLATSHPNEIIASCLKAVGDDLVNKLAVLLDSKNDKVLLNAIYVVSCIASGKQVHKKVAFDPKLFTRVVDQLEHPNKEIRFAAVHMVQNLVLKDDAETDNKIKKSLIEIKIHEKLQ